MRPSTIIRTTSVLPALLAALVSAGHASPLIRQTADHGVDILAITPLRETNRRQGVKTYTARAYMYEYGRGLPQNYAAAAHWYWLAAQQGEPTAQFRLGLLYDKGHGVPQDFVEAHKWLNLAVASASPRDREFWARIRDAVAFKMSSREIIEAQRRALLWHSLFW